MPDPLIQSAAMVGEWDGASRGWAARDWVAGPAGTVGLTLPGGVELDVDIAAPITFVGLWVDVERSRQPGLEAIATLFALVGERRATALFGLDRGGVQQLPSGDRINLDPDRVRRLDRGTDPVEPGLVPALARHALANADAVAMDASDLVVALSLIDAAASAVRIDGLDLDRRAQTAARRGAELLADSWSADAPIDDAALRRALRDLDDVFTDGQRRAVRVLLDGPAGLDRQPLVGFGELAAQEEALETTSVPAARLASAIPRSAPVARLRPVDVSTLPESFSVIEAAARHTRDAEAEVRIPGRPDLAERLWARSFDADGVILAAAPLLDDRGDAVARLLVPPAALATASFDVTDRPSEAPPSPRLRATVDAIAHGRSAARAERLQDPKETFARWGRAGEAWRTAGDDGRAITARRYAEASGRDPRVPPPLLADPLIEAGG